MMSNLQTQENNTQPIKDEPVVIKKKKVHRGHGHHGGAWKVAYADFVTAMMAFFIVMWILASSEQTKKLISEYFNNPGAFSFVSGKRAVPVDLNLQNTASSGQGSSNSKGAMKISFSSDSSKDAAKISGQASMDSVKAAEHVRSVGEEIKNFVKQELSKHPDLKELLNSINIVMTKEGLRIELIESKESLFFEVGSSRLSNNAQSIMIKLAQEIGKLPNYVDIEGHTDSRKYGNQSAYTNWELSADRANTARRVLEKNGLWEGQIIKVTGYADRKLRTPENPFDISNRRISILIRQLGANDLVQNIK